MIKFVCALILILPSINVAEVKTNKSKIEYSHAVKTASQYWQVEPQDIIKAQQLQEQYRGLISQTITPIELLGIFAQNAHERAKYAKIFAQLMDQTTRKVLQFNQAVINAQNELYGQQSMFDDPITSNFVAKRLQKIIDLNNCDRACLIEAKQLINNSANAPVDFYFVNANSDASIQAFAVKLDISIDAVNTRQITLNYAP